MEQPLKKSLGTRVDDYLSRLAEKHTILLTSSGTAALPGIIAYDLASRGLVNAGQIASRGLAGIKHRLGIGDVDKDTPGM